MRSIILCISLCTALLFSQGRSEFPFISLNTTKADIFVKNNPRFNGDGVIIFILDSGVDMGVQGLETLPDGSVKVIDVQDFSRQGDVYFQEAFWQSDEEGPYLSDGVIKVYGAEKLSLVPVDTLYYIGVFSESQFINSQVEDPNNDGNYDNEYPVLVFKTIVDTAARWIAYVDTDGDTNIDDEKAVSDYRINHDVLNLRGRDKTLAPDILTIGINILPHEQIVSFHFDDNAHGTHCAGIAAGYQMHGQKGFNGVAPGARVISLKIGNNTLSGGATITESMKRAFNYASTYAAAHPEYFYVLSMSYGIGSEIEGKSEIDLYADQFFRDNPHLTLLTSNGNEGPGLSTTGTPAASHRIMSVGAMLPQESARNTYGFFTEADEIFYFSSRGGDSEKPDFVAPGAASSTVPYFENRENMWGTSMAAPHAAGGVALLLSALKKTDPRWEPDNLLLKRSLQNTARKMAGYNWLDQGGGLIDIPKAWDKLKTYYSETNPAEVIDYKVSAPNTEYDEQYGYTFYYNAAGTIPKGKQEIKIISRLPESWDADKKVRYFQSFNVITEGDFFSVRQQEKYFKGKNSASLHLYFDENEMANPGLYTGMVFGVPKEKTKKRENAIFNIPITVVRPHYFTQANEKRLQFRTPDLPAGKIQRYFIQVEDNVSALKITMDNDNAPENRYRLYVFDHEGRNIYTNYSNEKRNDVMLLPQENERGTWELVAYSEFSNRGTVELKLNIEAYYISITELNNPDLTWQAGENPMGRVTFVNNGAEPLKAALSGEITGYKRTRTYKVNSDEYRFALRSDRFINKIEYDIEILDDDYLKMTDFAVNILDYDGIAVIHEGFTYKRMKIVFYPEAAQEYQMEFIGGFTHSYQAGWKMRIKETRYYTLPYKLFTYPDRFSGLELFPQKPLTASFEVEEPLPSLPKGFAYKFIFRFADDKKDAEIPVHY